MTDLLNVEFVDQKGVTRRLTREELLTYISVVSGAGNETTTRLIGWAGKVLAEHPDQRRELAENPALIPAAVEELLRYEPPAPHVARYVTRDVTYYGQTVPKGSAMMMLIGAAAPAITANSRRTATFSIFTASHASTSPSASERTTVSARRRPGWRGASRSKRS
jgi:hypothetical protein